MLMNIFRKGKLLINFLNNTFEEVMITILTIILVSSLSFSVFVRFSFHCSFLSMASQWTEEAASFSFIWLLYFGACLAAREGKHFSITAQFSLFPKRFKKYLVIPGNLVWLMFNIVIIKYGWELTKFSFEPSLAMEIPMKYIYFIIPFAFGLMSFRLIQHTYRTLKLNSNPEDIHA